MTTKIFQIFLAVHESSLARASSVRGAPLKRYSKNNGPVLLFKTYLGTETVSCRLLLRMTKIDMD